MCVRWGNLSSPDFLVGNRVKQGGIISPILFNIYMDDLSMHLNSSGIGGYLGTAFINHLYYADDYSGSSVCHLAGYSNSYIINYLH